MDKAYDIAVVIINYNNAQYTIDCINSICKNTSPELSIQYIIIDNASGSEDLEKLQKFARTTNIPHLTLFPGRINTGFGGGNMLGVQFANAKYYAFINNDTLLLDDCLKICYEFMESNAEAGVCGPHIKIEEKGQAGSFDHFISLTKLLLGNAFLETAGIKPRRKISYPNPIKVDYVNGSFMFFRASDFENSGGFDTNIFLFYEESDLCKRLKKEKKFCYYIPQAKYLHFEGKSQGTSIRKKIELKLSMLYVLRKHEGHLVYLIAKGFLILKYSLSVVIKPGYLPLLKVLLKGTHLSDSLKQDQKILENRWT
ncbi:glycosyltransferase family 2 protein [Robertkochia marina]|uniref:Glycosyltransferase family 2 protein n=1 Tax=Robertkochia marina TaxID=1227945 RepID=A0A4V3UYC6_9FLAO|nr:glycosyltransferase family 2 protein [Robertkochia marina]THD69158.1 glycosyltransferase family 2 protein [Robertkochia marina]TRZ47584.1 glycosyltransferase family 2 protein [Robertkochia marina]